MSTPKSSVGMATPARSGIPTPRSAASTSTATPDRVTPARPKIPTRSLARPAPTSGPTSPVSPHTSTSLKASTSTRPMPSTARSAQPFTPARAPTVPVTPTVVKRRERSDSHERNGTTTPASQKREHRPTPLSRETPSSPPQSPMTAMAPPQPDEMASVNERLQRAEMQYRVLQAEHARCQPRIDRSAAVKLSETDEGLLKLLYDRETLANIVRSMPKEKRTGLLGVIAEACRPSDIQAQIEVLERYKELRTGVLNRLNDTLCGRVIQCLGRRDILQLRLVSKRFDHLATRPSVWRQLCKELESTWDGTINLNNYHLDDEGDWLGLYKRLWQREKQWTNGLVQSLVLLSGHSNYVTSLKLCGETLISGSYDDTIRVWHLPYAVSNAKAVPPPQVITAKSVSSIDYYAPEQVLVTGSHDVGRASVWRITDGEWKVERILSGHLHGTRAVAINSQWLVSVGADKAIVVWDWRNGSKVVRFGQQTNVCVGMNLLDNFIITATVDGVIRSFSIAKREMLGQFKLSELAARQPEFAAKLKDVGSTAMAFLTWFEAEGRYMACATKDIVIRLAWDWADKNEQTELGDGVAGVDAVVSPISPMNAASGASPLRTRMTATASPSPRSHTASPMRKRSTAEDSEAPRPNTTAKLALHRRPRIVEILDITGTERGAFEAGRVRIVTSRRTSTRAGAERRVIVGTERTDGGGDKPTMQLVPLGGMWDTEGRQLGLHNAAKNPMSLALDHDKLVYGCSDGSIVVAGFVGAHS